MLHSLQFNPVLLQFIQCFCGLHNILTNLVKHRLSPSSPMLGDSYPQCQSMLSVIMFRIRNIYIPLERIRSPHNRFYIEPMPYPCPTDGRPAQTDLIVLLCESIFYIVLWHGLCFSVSIQYTLYLFSIQCIYSVYTVSIQYTVYLFSIHPPRTLVREYT